MNNDIYTREAPGAIEQYAVSRANGVISDALHAACSVSRKSSEIWAAKYAHDLADGRRVYHRFRRYAIQQGRKNAWGNAATVSWIASRVFQTWIADGDLFGMFNIGKHQDIASTLFTYLNNAEHSEEYALSRRLRDEKVYV